MSATALVAWALVVWGHVAIVTLSRLFKPLRERLGGRETFLGTLTGCAMCFGFWAGAWWSLLGVLSPSSLLTPGWFFWGVSLARAFLDGCAASAVSYAALVVLVALGSERL